MPLLAMSRVRALLLPLLPLQVLVNAPDAAAQGPSRASALESLVAAERAFAKASVDHDMRDAFLANLAADAIVFRPGPVQGRKWFEENPPSSAYLNWDPVFADVATSGELGFTTGPYELRPQGASDTTRRYGHYVTLWRRAPGGVWKVALDIGTSHPKPPARTLVHRASENRVFPEVVAARAALLRADSSLGVTGGMQSALLGPRLAVDAWLHRAGVGPVIGAAPVGAALATDARTYRSSPLDGDVAASADFGYTYGDYTLTGGGSDSEQGNYLRIWRRSADGAWLILLDLTSPRR